MSIKNNYRFSLSTNSKTESERLVLLLTIGLAVALQERAITINEAEQYLFSPYSERQLKGRDVEQKIIDLINLGAELEDVESLLPDRLEHAIDYILQNSLEYLGELSSRSC